MIKIPEHLRFTGDQSDLRFRFDEALAGYPSMNGDSGATLKAMQKIWRALLRLLITSEKEMRNFMKKIND